MTEARSPRDLRDLYADTWREAAACAPPERRNTLWFFPDKELDSRLGVRLARELCAGCPVKVECLAHALSIDQPGIYAGTTQDMRRPHVGSSSPTDLALLLDEARRRATRGPWRIVRDDEWVG